jgi:hypothetical protein
VPAFPRAEPVLFWKKNILRNSKAIHQNAARHCLDFSLENNSLENVHRILLLKQLNDELIHKMVEPTGRRANYKQAGNSF